MSGTLRGKGPWGFLGAVVAVVAIEAAVARHDLALSRTECFDWRLARWAAGKAAVGCDILCLGTSMVQMGALPEVIERRSGRPTYNLAVCAGRVPYCYYFLRRALAAGAKPSAVLIDFHPAFITSNYKANRQGWEDVLGVWECFDMAWTLRDIDIFTTTVLAKAIPTLYNRHQIRAGVRAALTGLHFSMWEENLAHIRNLRRNKGAFVAARNSTYCGEVSMTYRQTLMGPDTPCDPVKGLYINKLLSLAARHGIRVYWLVMPFCPALQQGREALGLDASYTRFVNTFRRYTNLVVLDARRSKYEPSVFLDACHLDPQGAYVFSTDVAAVLRRFNCGQGTTGAGGSRPQWIALPRYLEAPVDVPLETLPQSKLALFGSETVHR